MTKKTSAISLVLVTGLLTACSDDPKGHYEKKWVDSLDSRGHVWAFPRYYFIPNSGTPTVVTEEEFSARSGEVTRGGFGGSAHSAGEGAHGGAGE